jgi:O-antigen biosynthesis protein WbqV
LNKVDPEPYLAAAEAEAQARLTRRKPPAQAQARAERWGPWAVYTHDLLWACAAMALAILASYRFEDAPWSMVWRASLTFTAVCAFVFPAFGLHRGMWRFTALNDVLRIAQAVVVADLCVVPILFLTNRLEAFPRTASLFLVPIAIAGLSLGRAFRQAWVHGDLGAAFRLEDRAAPPAVVVGSPSAAAAYLSALRRNPGTGVRVVGIVGLNGAPHGRTIRGAEVLGGLASLGPILKGLAATDPRPPQVILAEPRPSRALLESVVATAGEAGAQVSRLRRSDNLGSALAPLEAADLLDRPPHALDLGRAKGLIAGKRVLVTGAGGTIGSELVRQILQLGPARLILADASEFNLYALDQALHEAGAPRVWSACLLDVRDRAALKSLFERERPDVVLHAAALKHVPLMELNPAEAVLTNLEGAINVARLAREACEALVFISTDKAVNPTNVMGATKRIAERAVRAIAEGGRARVAVVRFGNVLGSTGSVVPLFERQIASGGPVTVTHPEMVRYFMTVQEAASLVLQAAALPTGEGSGRIYVLDMGEPVRIDQLARQLVRLHGLRPDQDIQIVFTGLRPGEKLSEEIFYDAEDVAPTDADGVLAASDPAQAWAELEAPIAELIAAAVTRDETVVLARLQALEPAFRPTGR